MAYTEEQLTLLEAALAKGEKRVTFGDKTVEYRTVRTGLRHGDLVVVESGLNGGERIVLDGHLRLTPGAAVTIRNQGEGAGPADTAPGAGQ